MALASSANVTQFTYMLINYCQTFLDVLFKNLKKTSRQMMDSRAISRLNQIIR